MHLEILCEDRSGSLVVAAILQDYQRKRGYAFTYNIRPHRGKGYAPADPARRPPRDTVGLLDLLPAKARAYAHVLDPQQNILIVIMDADEIPPQQVERELLAVLRPYARPLPHLIGLCVEEMEAWLLGDRQAIQRAYPQADLRVIDRYEQDSICGTWEVLARCLHPAQAERLIRIGYPAVGQYKHRWSRNISRHLDIDRNVSPSLIRFVDRLHQAVSRMSARRGRDEERRTHA